MAAERRVLVTGAGGFVGRFVVAALLAEAARDGIALSVVASGQGTPEGLAGPGVVAADLDIADRDAVDAAVARLRPTGVIHLAAIAEPARARSDPHLAWDVNVLGTVNVGVAVLRHAPDARLVFAGSSEAYGTSFNAAGPGGIDESAAFAPQSNYAATKAAADLWLGQMARDGLRSVRFRPFNHTGPGQDPAYVVPSFARQIARIERGEQPPRIAVGNQEAARDFLDVRDVARAYVRALDPALDLPAGVAMNLASGYPRRIGDILSALMALSPAPMQIAVDPARLRASDILLTRGDATRARQLLGWAPVVPFEQTLVDVLAHCRREPFCPKF